jgi:hypothetical protein
MLNRFHDLVTVELGYNEQLGTGHFCSLQRGFVITGLICVLKLPISQKKFVRYNRVFVNNRVYYNRVSLFLDNGDLDE